MGEVNFFSYFLANQVGHLFTLMPISNNLVVLRILCSLFVSTEIVISTLFCLNKLKLNKWLVFLGEFVAVSLCYSPSVILYNHISFLILLASIMLIYTGLTEEKKYCLFFAGACLGLGLYVRFSNAVFPLLILAVFYYCYLNKSKAAEWVKCTIYCILGFAVSFFALYVCIGIKYGFSAYYDGIMKLFSISENAKGYSAFSMLAESLKGYVMGARSILVTVLVAILSMFVYSMALKRVNKEKAVLAKAVISGCASACVILLMLVCKWINLKPYFYGIIYYSAALFADLIIILFAKTFFDRKADANNKLIMLLLFLWIVVLSVPFTSSFKSRVLFRSRR